MSIFRSYFSKNNTLVGNSLINSSQNPVTEITYGTYNFTPSRFIFDIDLTELKKRIDEGFINPKKIVKHVLKLTNTIRYASEYLGKKYYISNIERASSFRLDLFNIEEEWDEGSGYDIVYDNIININTDNIQESASNWFYRKSFLPWTHDGIYYSGSTIIGHQYFEKGDENIEIDVTDYINQRLYEMGVLELSGYSAYTGDSFGLGLKFADYIETGETKNRQIVAFHTKNTNTWYEPYVETVVDDVVLDDRNYFYLDKQNKLFLYINQNYGNHNIIVDRVEIYDNNENIIDVISGDSIEKVNNNTFYINYIVDSNKVNDEIINDGIIFTDKWYLKINDKEVVYAGSFYLISSENFYNINNQKSFNFNNYHFYFWGIEENENIVAGDIRKINLTVKELYPIQDNNMPLFLEYRLFVLIDGKHEIDVIPYTEVNRTCNGYEIDLDTSWLIPQDYYLQIRMRYNNLYRNKETLKFRVISNEIIFNKTCFL